MSNIIARNPSVAPEMMQCVSCPRIPPVPVSPRIPVPVFASVFEGFSPCPICWEVVIMPSDVQ
jgi:hypothetical protein